MKKINGTILVKYGYNGEIKISCDEERIYITMFDVNSLTEYGLKSSEGNWLKCDFGVDFIVEQAVKNYDPSYTCSISIEGENHMFFSAMNRNSLEYLLKNILKDLIK